MQEFYFEVKDRKGTKNQVVEHFFRLEDDVMQELDERSKIDDIFSDEHVLSTSHDLIPWFADFSNYLASDIVPSGLSFHQRKKFMDDVKIFYWMSLTYTEVELMAYSSLCAGS